MLGNYEIRKIQGKDIFCKEFFPGFWVINGFLVWFLEYSAVTDEDISLALDFKEKNVNTKDNDVLIVEKVDEKYVFSWYDLDNLTTDTVSVMAKKSLDEYKDWVKEKVG